MKRTLTARNLLYLSVMSRFALRMLAITCLAAFHVASFSQQTPPTTPPPATTTTTPAPFDAKVRQEVIDGLTDTLTKHAFVPGVDFSKWQTFLDSHRADIDKTEDERAFATELNRVLKQFGVSHIALRTPRSATQRRTGTTSGLGMTVKKTDAGLEIVTVLPQGPAGQGGLETGDVIKEVDGKPATDQTMIRIDVGKSIAVKVLKKDGTTNKDLTL